jgi:hypothetical protein
MVDRKREKLPAASLAESTPSPRFPMDHPYRDLENSPTWKAIGTAISELESNDDLHLTTDRVHVIGYLCRQLAAAGILADHALPNK